MSGTHVVHASWFLIFYCTEKGTLKIEGNKHFKLLFTLKLVNTKSAQLLLRPISGFRKVVLKIDGQ